MAATNRFSRFLLAFPLVIGSLGAQPQLPLDPREIPLKAQLTSVKAKADLNGDRAAEEILLVEAMTGESDPARATEIILGVFTTAPEGGRGALLWSHRIAAESRGPAHGGEFAAVDLDGDGKSELILTWDRSTDPKVVDRAGAILVFEDLSAPRRVWEGEWEKDTRRDEATPPSLREKFRRDIDYAATRREAGRAIHFTKTYSMLAGRPLDPPRTGEERAEAPLRR